MALKSGKALLVGIDVGSDWSVICFLDEDGNVIEMSRMSSTSVALEKIFGGLPAMRIVFESGGHANWMRRRLVALGHEVTVADPRRLKLLWDSHSKDDKRDARFLAEVLLYCPQMLHAVEPRSLESEQNRALLRLRASLVEARVKLINSVRGVLKSFGERLPSSTSEAFVRMASPRLSDELRPQAYPALLTIEALTAQIKVYDKRVLELCNGRYREATERLRTVPGVGPLTALTFVLELDGEVSRLSNSRAAGALVGLVQSAQYMLGHFGCDCALRRWGLKLAGDTKRGKKRAVVAVARKLAVLLHTLWRKGVDFDPAYGLEQAA
jgi:transposase